MLFYESFINSVDRDAFLENYNTIERNDLFSLEKTDFICKANKKTPALFSRVTSELQWIKANMEGQRCSPPKKTNPTSLMTIFL